MNIKTSTVDAKADGSGSISGYAATWTREPDSYGDVIAKGAFAESIAAIAESGKTLPLLWNHDSGDLKAYIGTVKAFAEDDHGLYFEADFDETPEAQRARELAQDGRLCKFSFAYDTLDQGTVTLDDGREANELRKLNIHEVSLVLYPANRDTSVVEVKGASDDANALARDIAAQLESAYAKFDAKAGRRNSKADADALRSVLDACADAMEEIASIQSTISGLLEGETPDDGQEPEAGPEEGAANAEEPDTANAEEPGAKSGEVDALLKQATEILEGGF